MGMNELLLTW